MGGRQHQAGAQREPERRQDAAFGGGGGDPAPHDQDEHRQPEKRPGRLDPTLHGAQERGVSGEQRDAGRAPATPVWVVRRSRAVEVGQATDHREGVGAHDHPQLPPGGGSSGGEGQHQVDQDGLVDDAEEDPDGDEGGHPAPLEVGQKPREALQDHQQPRPAPRLPPGRDQAGGDEGPADGQVIEDGGQARARPGKRPLTVDPERNRQRGERQDHRRRTARSGRVVGRQGTRQRFLPRPTHLRVARSHPG